MPGNDRLTGELAAKLGCDVGHLEVRQFPDGETYLRLLTNPAGRAIAIICTLEHPNDKLLPLLFAAATARELKSSTPRGLASYRLISPTCARTGVSSRVRR
jgi:ribose-phosphate pyrophosphokinase